MQPSNSTAPNNPFVALGALLLMIGVGLGAFGAHALQLTGRMADIYETATLYLFIHGLGVLVFGVWDHGRLPGWLLFVGTLIFSGSLYILVFSGLMWLGAITPIGGVLMIAGWGALTVSATKR